jgi:GxxExxY protein
VVTLSGVNHDETDVAMLEGAQAGSAFLSSVLGREDRVHIDHGRCDFTTETRRHGVLLEGELTERIIGAAIDVHRSLGPGLLESVYEECLCYEFGLRDLKYERQVELPILYKDVMLSCGYRADVIVESAVLLELKAVERVLAVHEAQLLTYLRLSAMRVGLLLNFNVSAMKNGIVRRVL